MSHLTIQKYKIMHRSIASRNNKFHEMYTLAFRSNSHYINILNLYSWNYDAKSSLLGTYSCATNNDLSFSIQCWYHITKQKIFQIYAAVFTSRPCLFRIVFRWHILAVLRSVGVFLQYAVMHNYLGNLNVLCVTAYWINILFRVGLEQTVLALFQRKTGSFRIPWEVDLYKVQFCRQISSLDAAW